jgi:sugar phosphate isomerase/epimerase
MKYPKIHLAIDNCFAYKRWTKPEEWCSVISDLGLQCIEASADNELDPLFMGREYLKDWIGAVKEAQKKSGVKVVSLYSGHGTYTTLGLTHTDPRVRRRMIEDWFKPMMETAAELEAGFGFFAHAFPHYALQDPVLYRNFIEILILNLIEINRFGTSRGCKFLAIEQMYTPHQYPWTIRQAKELIHAVSVSSGSSFYFTEDVGHHQSKFIKPEDSVLKQICGKPVRGIWLGSDSAYLCAEQGDLAGLKTEIAKAFHLFAELQDSDCYAWLLELGLYSPIIHLQQTDGQSSEHRPFTEANNAHGIIDGAKVLKALKTACNRHEKRIVKPCEDIYLTLELFAGTSAFPHDLLSDIRKSVDYWRKWIPEDGIHLDSLV